MHEKCLVVCIVLWWLDSCFYFLHMTESNVRLVHRCKNGVAFVSVFGNVMDRECWMCGMFMLMLRVFCGR